MKKLFVALVAALSILAGGISDGARAYPYAPCNYTQFGHWIIDEYGGQPAWFLCMPVDAYWGRWLFAGYYNGGGPGPRPM